MKQSKLEGFLVVCLHNVPSFNVQEIRKEIINAEFNPLLAYYVNYSLPVSVTTDTFLQMPKLVNQQRLKRLQFVAQNIYRFEIFHSTELMSSILHSSKEEEPDRLIIFQTNNLVQNYVKLIELFSFNSFLFQRDIHLQDQSSLFIPAGFIGKNKLNRMLQGKGNRVNPFTFQVIKPVLDRDFVQNVDTIHHKIYERNADLSSVNSKT